MKIPVHWWDAQMGNWDHTQLIDTFNSVGLSYEFEDTEIPVSGVLVLSARGLVGRVPEVQAAIDRMEWVLLIIMSDEENVFPWRDLKLPERSAVWIQNARPGLSDGADRFLGCGYTPRQDIEQKRPTQVWSFSGQSRNPERRKAETAMILREHDCADGTMNITEGFGQGMGALEYAEFMMSARVIPSPGGNFTADTFRTHEALEIGRIPLASKRNDSDPEGFDFWENTYGEVPFPRIENWDVELPALLDKYSKDWLREANKCWAWWQMEKRKLRVDLCDTVEMISYDEPHFHDITVLIPTSVVESNPDMSHIEEVVQSIRNHPDLKDTEIIVMIDGVRNEQSHYQERYDEFVRSVLTAANNSWTNVVPLLFDEHTHQAGMTREALKLVRTEYILFVEHDTPLVAHDDHHSNIKGMVEAIRQRDDVNVIRLHYDVSIHVEHEHLMLGGVEWIESVPLIPTQQWSQRPHLASTLFYQKMLEDNFAEDALTMIEDKMHSVLQVKHAENKWAEIGYWIYADGYPNDMKYSGHSDARGKDSKYEESFTW